MQVKGTPSRSAPEECAQRKFPVDLESLGTRILAVPLELWRRSFAGRAAMGGCTMASGWAQKVRDPTPLPQLALSGRVLSLTFEFCQIKRSLLQ